MPGSPRAAPATRAPGRTEDAIYLADAGGHADHGRVAEGPERLAEAVTEAGLRPAEIVRRAFSGSRTSVSTRVFQALQLRHCPSQRRKAAPHAWQT